jgi:signal transduction histidine kinase
MDELKARLLQVEQELVRCERISIATRFTAAVVHEATGPLEAIANLAYLLEVDASGSPNSRAYLGMLQERLTVLAQVLRASLVFEREQQGPQAIDLVEIARASLRLHFSTLSESRIRVHTRFADRAMSHAVATDILQVLSHLVLNAMDGLVFRSMPTLHIRVHRRQGGIYMTVADNGSGISEETETKLDENVTGERGDTGKRLWHAKRLVLKHGGAIRVRTRRTEGRSGTVFLIRFPHAEAS